MNITVDIPKYEDRVYRGLVFDSLVDRYYEPVANYIDANITPTTDIDKLCYDKLTMMSKSMNLYSGLTLEEVKQQTQLSSDMKYWVEMDDGTYWFKSHEAEDWRFTIPIAENPVRMLKYNGVVCQYIKFKDTSQINGLGMQVTKRLDEGITGTNLYTKLKGAKYKAFWNNEIDKCCEGFDTDSIHVPGRFYHYMNFGTVLTYKFDKDWKRVTKTIADRSPQIRPPSFTDHMYYLGLEIEAAYGEGRNDPDKMFAIVFVKSRRIGATYGFKDMTTSFNYNYIKNSKNHIITLSKPNNKPYRLAVQTSRDFINENTEMRQRILSRLAGNFSAGWYVNSTDTTHGSRSEVNYIAMDKDDQKSVGEASNNVTYEEAGANHKLIAHISSNQPLCFRGDLRVAPEFAFGTGGDMSKGTKALFKLFFNPIAHKFKGYDNIHDSRSGKIGLFFDACWYRTGMYQGHPMVDEYGNSWRMLASIQIDTQIEVWSKSDETVNNIAYFPKKPLHAFLQQTDDRFDIVKIAEQKEKVRAMLDEGEFDENIGRYKREAGGSWKFEKVSRSEYIDSFPISNKRSKKGAVLKMVPPVEMAKSDDPNDFRYIMAIDGYDQDKSVTSLSLGSAMVYDLYTREYVAEFTSRESLDDFWDQTAGLAYDYDARVSYDSNSTGYKEAFILRNAGFRLLEVPDYITKNTKSIREYGVPMTTKFISQATGLLEDFFKSTNELYKVLNIYNLFSLPCLDELPELGKMNTDRMTTMLIIKLIEYNINLIKGISKNNETKEDGIINEPPKSFDDIMEDILGDYNDY